MIYRVQNVKNYPDDGNHQQVVWQGIFMPFDVVKGLDSFPPDSDATHFKKTNWWATPRHYIGIPTVDTKEFSTLDEAISFCLEWRKEWLTNELNKEA